MVTRTARRPGHLAECYLNSRYKLNRKGWVWVAKWSGTFPCSDCGQ